jgi:hypothetical protein
LIFNEPGVISRANEILEVGQNLGLIDRSGNTYTYSDGVKDPIKLGVGNKAARLYLYEDQKLSDEIEIRIRTKMKESKSAITNIAQADSDPSESEDEDGLDELSE